jgi:hypothetical protein
MLSIPKIVFPLACSQLEFIIGCCERKKIVIYMSLTVSLLLKLIIKFEETERSGCLMKRLMWIICIRMYVIECV